MRGNVHHTFKNPAEVKKTYAAMICQLLQAYAMRKILKEVVAGFLYRREVMSFQTLGQYFELGFIAQCEHNFLHELQYQII